MASCGFPERTLQALWFAGALPEAALRTDAGLPVEVLDPGTWNRGGGPDFLGARLRIGGRTERGHVEVHCDERDWERHGHDGDPAYDDLLLHLTLAGAAGPDAGPARARHTVRLERGAVAGRGTAAPEAGRCRATLAHPHGRARMAEALREAGQRKLERRAERMHREAERVGWPAALVKALARALGQPENGAALERIAAGIDTVALDEACQEPGGFRDPTRVEAMFMAHAGCRGEGADDRETARYFAAVAALGSVRDDHGPRTGWQMGGTRPLGSPWRRLAGLAAVLAAFGGPTPLHEEIVARADAGVDAAALGAFFVRREGGYWARRTRPGRATLARPAALIGAAYARHLAREVVFPFLLGVLQARGDAAGIAAFWSRVEETPAQEEDGVLRFVAARMGGGGLGSTWVRQLGMHWFFRTACGAGGRGCAACVWRGDG